MRYRFGPFCLSRAQRVLTREGVPVPLIPRYFDLLVLLIEQRERAVSKQEIFDRVWADVVVSDSALTQAIRTIRRTLGDDPREPRYLRTVARHGYQFVCAEVEVEPDSGPIVRGGPEPQPAPADDAADPFAPLLAVLLREPPYQDASEDQRYAAAVALHELGTAEALRRLDERPGHEEARAILRDARWDAPDAGPVPLLSATGRLRAIAQVVGLRARHAARLASVRWATGALGASIAGLLAGLGGGLVLGVLPDGVADGAGAVTLALVGAVAGAMGGAGVGAGLAAAEALSRSARAVSLSVCGAVAGAATGWIAHAAARALLLGLFGRDVAGISGPFEGLVLGGATGLGYALATRRLPQGGMAAPRGAARWRAAALTGLVVALAAMALAAAGRHLVGSSLDLMAGVFAGSQVGLAPLAHLLGEETFLPRTRVFVSAFEGLMFGIGITLGLTRRPRTGR